MEAQNKNKVGHVMESLVKMPTDWHAMIKRLL